MPFSSGSIHVAQPLIDLCQAYKPDEEGYLRSVFFPRKPVQHDTDKVWKVSKSDTLRKYDLKASDRGAVKRIQYRPNGTYTYQCEPFAAAAELTPMEMKNADSALKHELRQTKQAMISMGIEMEGLAMAQLRDTSVMTAYESLAAGTRWDDFSSASSQPIEDLQSAIEQIRTLVGKTANKINGVGGKIHIGMSNFTGMILRQHPNVLSRLTWNPSGTGAILTQKILADLLAIDENDIHITSNHYTSSQEGETAAAYKQFIGSDVVLAYVDESDPDNDQALGHEFIFDGLEGDGAFLVRRWREEFNGYAGIDVVGVAAVVDYKVVNAANAGFVFKTAIDPNDSAYAGMLD